ncbi:hypothetical protein F5882DRAFT_396103 [Hyaloscypha sp. PMI_1271]|nr:hypothetical protein F5882DRAFT_396103 [Hyaloscypha sp. PMI_1271]
MHCLLFFSFFLFFFLSLLYPSCHTSHQAAVVSKFQSSAPPKRNKGKVKDISYFHPNNTSVKLLQARMPPPQLVF